jgi:cell wall-associated NlpC family hydrolase
MYFLIAFYFLAFISIFPAFSQSDSLYCRQNEPSFTQNTGIDIDSLLRHAHTCLGKKYRYSGKSPKTGFDCAGFVFYNFKKFGIILPYSSCEQIKRGIEIGKEEAMPGDLIFFKGRSLSSKRAGHVGIVVKVSDRTIHFIHAAVTGGVRYDSMAGDYYRKRFIGLRRLKS